MTVIDRVRGHLRPTDDEHRVTTLELLFDLVFVYAITNVTHLMEEHVGGEAVLEGIVTLAIVWFGWCAYTWLGNQAKADEGLLRVAMVIAMAGMFFVAISIPYAFSADSEAAMVLAVSYAVVRLTHLAVYLVAAGDDRQLRSVVLGMLAVASVMLVLLFAGAAVGGEAQKWWWVAAVAVDQAGVYFVRSTRWRLNSASHFAERFGLILIIAIGESIVAVGTSTSENDITGRDAVALLCGLAIAVCLWWLYFDVVATVAERAATGRWGRARASRSGFVHVHPLPDGRWHRVRLARRTAAHRQRRPHRRRSLCPVRRARELPLRPPALPAAKRRLDQPGTGDRRRRAAGAHPAARRPRPRCTDRPTGGDPDRAGRVRDLRLPRRAPRDPHVHVVIPAGLHLVDVVVEHHTS
ncbi:MAG: low temperature requirement protein A [Ilumatobacteraceae bacterium]